MAGRAATRVLQLQAPPAFEGRVHKWEQRWLPVVQGTLSNEVRLELHRWVRTDEMTVQPTGPRHPHLRPVTTERNKAVRIPSLQQPSQGLPASQQAEPMQVETASQQPATQPATQPAPQQPQPQLQPVTQPVEHPQQPQPQQPQPEQPHPQHPQQPDVVMHTESPRAHQPAQPIMQDPQQDVVAMDVSQSQPATQPVANSELQEGMAPWPQVQAPGNPAGQEPAPPSQPDNTPGFQ